MALLKGYLRNFSNTVFDKTRQSKCSIAAIASENPFDVEFGFLSINNIIILRTVKYIMIIIINSELKYTHTVITFRFRQTEIRTVT